MEKLLRFIGLAIMYLLLICLSLLIIPSASWLFGGEFIATLQHPAHLMFMIILSGFMWAAIFADCFDENFYSK